MTTNTQAWDIYWETNQSANSFAFDYSATEGPYGVVNAFWQQTFSQFNSGETIVDLGAGNGSLCQLYLQSSKDVRFKNWINIDSANANPAVKHNLVSYQQDDMNALSLPSESVDHFISMFGIEYANFSQSLQHVKHCLNDKGHFHFLMHHHNAVISVQSKITISLCERILQAGLLANLNRFNNIEPLKKHLLSALKFQLQQCPLNEQEDVKLIGQKIYYILHSTSDITLCFQQLELLSNQLDWQILRLKQQLEAANQVVNLPEYLQSHGISNYSLKELKYKEDILAWVLLGTKI